VSTWSNCVTHGEEDARGFIKEYFSIPDRQILIIGGAGFDPRSTVVTSLIATVAKNCRGIYVREERPDPVKDLLQRAESNVARLSQLVPGCRIESIDIFDTEDDAVVGAKRLIRLIAPLLSAYTPSTDIVLDLSALSIGIGFPLTRHLYDTLGRTRGGPRIHLFVTEDSALDAGITPEHTDQPMYVPGFDGGAALDQQSGATRLWIPQLVRNRTEALRRIHTFVRAEETCPILPLPAKNLRAADELLEHYITEITDAWEVDPRNYIYAAEREPLDLYRTLLRLDDARKRVYEAHGGSLLVLSPIGSRTLALGALLAALDRNFPVAYLESISYSPPASSPPGEDHPWPIVHIWLSGDT
jgi:hypothetical protein